MSRVEQVIIAVGMTDVVSCVPERRQIKSALSMLHAGVEPFAR